MNRTILTLAALATAAIATPASAQCSWVFDCTSGTCVQVPICRSTIDLPPIRPVQLPPLAPLPSIRPIQPPVIPPIGTRSCQQRYVCNGGQCSWQTVCR